jgi:triosephosphate isomerase
LIDKQSKYTVVANWKMHGSFDMCDSFANKLSTVCNSDSFTKIETVIAPPFLYLDSIGKKLAHLSIKFAGQDCHFAKSGAYTSDISADMLAELGCKYVILGHCERRKHYGETNKTICKKAESAILAGLVPIICIGEKCIKRAFEELKEQCKSCIPKNAEKIIIAYEPVYAIGTGIVPSQGEIKKAAEFIKSNVNQNAQVIYGGSVNEGNCKQIAQINGIQGLLVGSASIKPQSFSKIVTEVIESLG